MTHVWVATTACAPDGVSRGRVTRLYPLSLRKAVLGFSLTPLTGSPSPVSRVLVFLVGICHFDAERIKACSTHKQSHILVTTVQSDTPRPPPHQRNRPSSSPPAAMTKIDYANGTHKDFSLDGVTCKADVVDVGEGKTSMEITLGPGFDWRKQV